jgi:hypothetical protein
MIHLYEVTTMTEVHDTTNSSTSDAEIVMPGQSNESLNVPTTHTSQSAERLDTPENVEGVAHTLPFEMPRVVIVGAGFGGLRAA